MLITSHKTHSRTVLGHTISISQKEPLCSLVGLLSSVIKEASGSATVPVFLPISFYQQFSKHIPKQQHRYQLATY